jgi:outer membrane lipoprotein-sorting protein
VRKGLSSILSFVFLSVVSLGTPSWAQQESKNIAPILEQLKKAQESLEDFTADIKQVKISSLFTEPVISHGKMRLKRPNQIWVEMYPPYPNIMVLDKGVLLIYFPDERVAQRYQVAGNTANWMPKRLELMEKNGDSTTINYLNVKRNVGIADSSFRLHLPPDVEIIEPLRH